MGVYWLCQEKECRQGLFDLNTVNRLVYHTEVGNIFLKKGKMKKVNTDSPLPPFILQYNFIIFISS